MGCQGIVDLNLRRVTVSGERPLVAFTVCEGHEKIVDASQFAFYLLPVRQRYSDGGRRNMHVCGLLSRESASTSSRQEPCLLQDLRITELRAKAFEISGEGVTSGTGGLEVCFS